LSSSAGKADSKADFSEMNKVSKNVTRAHSRVIEKKGLIEDFSQELFGVPAVSEPGAVAMGS
jgi:hypothetical protein